jgi:hypothetical protein
MGIMWKNIVQRDRPQVTIWRRHFACWVLKAARTQTVQYLLLFHSNSGCTNAPHSFDICTFPALFPVGVIPEFFTFSDCQKNGQRAWKPTTQKLQPQRPRIWGSNLTSFQRKMYTWLRLSCFAHWNSKPNHTPKNPAKTGVTCLQPQRVTFKHAAFFWEHDWNWHFSGPTRPTWHRNLRRFLENMFV